MPETRVNVRYMVDDVDAAIAFYTTHLGFTLLTSAAGLRFRNDIVTGPGGSQILVDDPSGNPIELFQPAR